MKDGSFLNWLPKHSSIRRRFFFGLSRFISICLLILALNLTLPTTINKVFGQTPQTMMFFGSPGSSWPATTIVGVQNGPIVTREIRVSDVTDANGLAAFMFKVKYDKTLVSIQDNDNNGIADEGQVTPGGFLASAGKQTACSNPYLDPDQTNVNNKKLAYVCVTLGPTPDAPTGTGNLATIKFKPGSNLGMFPLTLESTQLANNSENPNLIPHIIINASFRVARCADFTGDHKVRMADVSKVVENYGTSNALYDLDENGIVLSPDITIAVYQYGITC